MNLARSLSIDGWMAEPELIWLANAASKSKNIIEAGSYKGRSTRALADNTSGSVHAVDPWDGKYQIYGSKDCKDFAHNSYHKNGNMEIYSQFYSNLNDHIKSGKLHIHMMNFTDYKPIEDDFDFIFLDAIHEYDALKADIEHALKLMKSGLLAGHDYCPGWRPVMDLVDELFGSTKKIHHTIWSVSI